MDSRRSVLEMRLTKALLGLPLIFVGLTYGQTGGGSVVQPSGSMSRGSIRGRVLLPGGSPVSEAVKVTLLVIRGEHAAAYTDQQGVFEINDLAPGQYVIEVEADRQRRFEVATEQVFVQRGGPTAVTIYLKEREAKATNKPADKTVSVAMLDQKVPGAARREFEKATQLVREGKRGEAITSLRRAIEIYPNYLMARNDLGAQLLEQGELDEATEHLRAGIEIDPKAFNPQLNLGIVLIRQKNFPEALATLEKALSLNSASPAAHLYAGIAASELQDSERGEREFQAAYQLGGTEFSIALFHLGQLYMNNGQRENAVKSFESYLREVPNAANAKQAEKLLGMLRSSP